MSSSTAITAYALPTATASTAFFHSLTTSQASTSSSARVKTSPIFDLVPAPQNLSSSLDLNRSNHSFVPKLGKRRGGGGHGSGHVSRGGGGGSSNSTRSNKTSIASPNSPSSTSNKSLAITAGFAVVVSMLVA